MKIEPMPNEATLALCRKAWDLTDITFVRKMENIVFSCRRHNQIVFLRLTTPFRRSKPQIEAELYFIAHLAKAGLRVPQVILNAHNQPMMTLIEDGQSYEAVVFSRVEGEHPAPDLVVMPHFLKSLGSLIATMHNVSQKYEPLSTREHWFEERGIRHALDAAKVSPHIKMREKLYAALQWIRSLERTPQSYGLVHADLGASNMFTKANGSIGVIDFDDACYHFYAFDIAIVIYSMANRFGHLNHNDSEKTWLISLLEGYRSVRTLTQEQVEQIPLFMDFACLRLYFWIEYHQTLDTFHDDALERISYMKQWAFQRINPIL